MPTAPSPEPRWRRRIEFREPANDDALAREWLVTNGLGGYGSGTLSGAVTWRYHGLLIAALAAPLGRTMMLNQLDEGLRFPDGRLVRFGGSEAFPPNGTASARLVEFRLEHHLPVWRYELGPAVLEKRILMPYLQNTLHVTYSLLEGPEGLALELQPCVHFRPFEANVGSAHPGDYLVTAHGHQFEVHTRNPDYPALRLRVSGRSSRFVHEGGELREVVYRRDAERGYEARGTLWSPGHFTAGLAGAEAVTFVASTESWHTVMALDPEAALATEIERRQRLQRIACPGARHGLAAELVLAADHFIIAPAGRVRDSARARAAGDELRSVIAGYHWFTDWGRDTMISLEGLALTTGRYHEAAWILRTFAHYVRDGLIPNLFPEGRNEGLYHTADASLWFFHAIDRYVAATGDREMLAGLQPVLRDVVAHHLRGTRFGIGVDPQDGLLRQGAPGYQLTWMDAKVGDWVVTPRRGKAVEINALWYNALRLMSGWLADAGDEAGAAELREHAARAAKSFNARFWNPATGCLFDVLDPLEGGPNDPAIRPNQLLAVSLTHPVLDQAHWLPVLEVVERELLTPLGLRTLSRDHPDYKSRYYGDLRSRDAAYHQGTVWAWLIGPYIDAWLKVHPGEEATARRFLEDFDAHLSEGCVGAISEIFDAEVTYTQRGCIAQAWSVAEVLRCLAKVAPKEE